jgi:hypothetical protein
MPLVYEFSNCRKDFINTKCHNGSLTSKTSLLNLGKNGY